ncbi:MAG: putative glycosyltransferase, exosortase G system-associated [Clostridiaceae bacterium]|nr:putative glycosyltransferase, exosortase G system-associated [Oscillospiraceae bacterium]NLO62238.1 putative glycosyltransferase, exosortase G system-associated [Clostridiaceae bacterium]
MEMFLNQFLEKVVFWMAWIIIPLVMEIIPAIGGFFILVRKRFSKKKDTAPIRFPEITLIIPVYNSEKTLERCLHSVNNSDYPKDKIHIMLVDNESKDQSFSVFCDCQKVFPELSMQWMKARQGKSKALNMSLFNSEGKYVLHIDSDGTLEPTAIRSMIERFEGNPNIHSMTGVILTDPEMIEKTDRVPLRLFRRCEFFEYCQAFLAGRNFESELDSIYTLSGAFSAFRKSTILKTQMYNTDTVCEDTHVTFQVRKLMKKSVHLCENAFFFTEPIEGVNQLYTQRQRWQIGEMEVSHMFLSRSLRTRNFFSDFMVRILAFDHTFAFPRMIWYFALICLTFLNYPVYLIVGSLVILYSLYIISAFFFYLNVLSYLKEHPVIRRYYARKWYIVPLMPAYNFVIFWIRFAGIINSIKNRSGWRTRTLAEEKDQFSSTARSDLMILSRVRKKLYDLINDDVPR